MTLDLHRLVLDELAGILRAAATVDDDRAHRIHLGCKRVRSYLRLLRAVLGVKRFKRENRFFRDLGRPFGAVRNSEVAQATVDKLLKDQPFLVGFGVDILRQVAEVAPPQDETATSLSAVMAAVSDAQARFLDTSRGKVRMEREVKHLYREGCRLFGQAVDSRTADDLHEWRKQVKYLRFALAAMEETGPEDAAWRKRLKKLAKVLGHHHDLSLLQDRVRAAGVTVVEILDVIERQEVALSDKARDLGQELYGRKPREFMEGLVGELSE
ncbi:CHAD domain protein [Asticcacaulis biprosthecium C19]|uniref:CHAD domain protein n=1 Tax=Asticcacaulis biprosthecium C19 TaxID=715226 RepID=F4QK54_9CAUL|nr:CHAD domain-containing protein [Asticcacaulis biprosthecium]EGF92081.1 CHAD domain protein [Asticcacaulis biprosthecium C19]